MSRTGKGKIFLLTSLCLIGFSASAQLGKSLDTAKQKEKINNTPTDTSGLKGLKNKPQGGENSGKNKDYQKPVKKKPGKASSFRRECNTPGIKASC